MSQNNDIILSRDIKAILIPSGDIIDLPKGLDVEITHALGGNFTVLSKYGLTRVSSTDADALGKEIDEKSVFKLEEGKDITTEDLWEALKTVFDPEIPVNIVDLGLVYRLELKKTATGKNFVEMDMSLTAPGCTLGPVIANDAKLKLEQMPTITEAFVSIVWDPPWNQEMMSQDALMELGFI